MKAYRRFLISAAVLLVACILLSLHIIYRDLTGSLSFHWFDIVRPVFITACAYWTLSEARKAKEESKT